MKVYTILFAFLFVVLVPTQVSQAQVISIDVPCNASALVNAIEIANESRNNDVLNLTPNCTYTVFSVNNSAGGKGPNGLPAIVNNGALTINGNGATIERSSSQQFRLLYVRRAANVTINNLTIRGGKAFRNGGGVFNDVGSITMTNTVITRNEAYHGGGIANEGGGFIQLANSAVVDNAAGMEGGGIYNDNAEIKLRDSIVAQNTAYYGGGIYNDGNLTLDFSSVMSNSADQGGGVYNTYLLISANSTFFRNNAVTDGGAVYTLGNGLLYNTTVFDNTGTTGGVYNLFRSLILFNSILAFNGGADCTNDPFVNPVGIVSGSNNLVRATGTCTGLANPVGGDPRLGDLSTAPNGTQYFPLRGGSAALNAGTTSSNPDTLVFDQTGSGRVVAGAVDLGASEATIALLDVDGDGEINPADAIFVTNRIGQPAQSEPLADVNGDGSINADDVNQIVASIGLVVPGS